MSWSQTFTDGALDLLAPRASDVRAADLAHQLGYQCRYAGACHRHWSTAQHSIIVALAVWHRTHDRDAAGHGLMHDGHEAYMGDQIHPLKMAIAQISAEARDALRSIARGVDGAIWAWAGLAEPDGKARALIKALDQGPVLALERSLVMGRPPKPWLLDELGVQPLTPADVGDIAGGELWSAITQPWANELAESAFRFAMHRILPLAPNGSLLDLPPWLHRPLHDALPRKASRT